MEIESIDISDEELAVFYKTIGQNVKRLRKERNYTQMKLALAIGHNSVGHIAKSELHKYNRHFSLEHLYKISRVLNVSLKDLVDLDSNL